MKSAEVRPHSLYWIERYNAWGQALKKKKYMFLVLLNRPPWGAWLHANELDDFTEETEEVVISVK